MEEDREVYEHRKSEIAAPPGSPEHQAELDALDAWLESRKPEALRSRVDLRNALERKLWQGYQALSGDRSVVVLPMGGSLPGAIPYQAAAEWLRNHQIDPAEWDEILGIWSQMDAVGEEAS